MPLRGSPKSQWCIGIDTLGMVDIDGGVDEDYLAAGQAKLGPGLIVQGFARRPTWSIAQSLKQQGAMIASGIMVGFAAVFVAHISKHWPGLTLKLMQLVAAACAASEECEVPCSYRRASLSTCRHPFVGTHPHSHNVHSACVAVVGAACNPQDRWRE